MLSVHGTRLFNWTLDSDMFLDWNDMVLGLRAWGQFEPRILTGHNLDI